MILAIFLISGGLLFLISAARALYRASEAGFEGDQNAREKHLIAALLFVLIGAVGIWQGVLSLPME